MKKIFYLLSILMITSCVSQKKFAMLDAELSEIITAEATSNNNTIDDSILNEITEDNPEAIKNVIDKIKASCLNDSAKPTNLGDLTGGYNVFYDEFTEEVGVEINLIPAGTISGNNSSRVIVYNFLQYKNSTCEIDGQNYPITWGAGIKLTLHVRSAKSSVNLTSLPAIAAAVNYNRARVTYRIKVEGITGTPVRLKLANQGEFNVENYGKLISSIDDIVKVMSEDGVTVDPQLVLLENSN